MDLISINFFFALGILTLLSVLIIKTATILNDPTQQSTSSDIITESQPHELQVKSLIQARLSNSFIPIHKNAV